MTTPAEQIARLEQASANWEKLAGEHWGNWLDRGVEIDRLKGELEQERVQHAGCLTAAEGATDPEHVASPGMYGWSLAYQKTLELRRAHDKLTSDLAEERGETARQFTHIHDLMDTVAGDQKIIHRTCQERDAFANALAHERGVMQELQRQVADERSANARIAQALVHAQIDCAERGPSNARVEALEGALRRIETCACEFKVDPLEHAREAVAYCRQVATEALAPATPMPDFIRGLVEDYKAESVHPIADMMAPQEADPIFMPPDEPDMQPGEMERTVEALRKVGVVGAPASRMTNAEAREQALAQLHLSEARLTAERRAEAPAPQPEGPECDGLCAHCDAVIFDHPHIESPFCLHHLQAAIGCPPALNAQPAAGGVTDTELLKALAGRLVREIRTVLGAHQCRELFEQVDCQEVIHIVLAEHRARGERDGN